MKYDFRSISKKNSARALYLRRKVRCRKKISGSDARPRLSVFRSAKHIYVQAIDDVKAITLASSSSMDSAVREKIKGLKNLELAKIVGEALGQKLKAANYDTAVFDRNGFMYTGRVSAVAEGLRSAGIKI